MGVQIGVSILLHFHSEVAVLSGNCHYLVLTLLFCSVYILFFLLFLHPNFIGSNLKRSFSMKLVLTAAGLYS